MTRTLLIVGSNRVGTLESSYARAFGHLGWTVHFWDPERALHQVARGLWPAALLAEYNLAYRDRVYLWTLYLAVTLAGLVIPATLFHWIGPTLAYTVRRLQQSLTSSMHP